MNKLEKFLNYEQEETSAAEESQPNKGEWTLVTNDMIIGKEKVKLCIDEHGKVVIKKV